MQIDKPTIRKNAPPTRKLVDAAASPRITPIIPIPARGIPIRFLTMFITPKLSSNRAVSSDY
jgi:hypothetical protein